MRRAIAPITGEGRMRRRNQRYDDMTLEVIRRELGDGDAAIDVGAFRGKLLAAIVEASPTGRHVAFEPNPELAAELRERFPTVDVRQAAVGARPGRTEFHVSRAAPARSGLLEAPDMPADDAVVVPTTIETLDGVVGERDVRLLKIDVEGAEVAVLRGGADLLRRCRPVVVLEHGRPAAARYGATPEDLHDLLAECGLRVWVLDDRVDGRPPLTRDAFLREKYETRRHWMFVAAPG